MLRSCQDGGDPVGDFDPEVCRLKDPRAGASAVKDFAEEPFAGIRSAASGEIFGVKFFCQVGDFLSLGDGGVVFPEPGESGRVVLKFFREGEGTAVFIDRQRGRAGGVYADADDLIGAETFDFFAGLRESVFDAVFGAFEIVGGMLTSEVRVAREDDSILTMLIVLDRLGDFPAVLDVDDQGADRIGSVIQT